MQRVFFLVKILTMITNLIPAAGLGKRFSDAGYKLPKPLIKVKGQPMLLSAAASLPEADRWIFLCRQEHIKSHQIDQLLKKNFSQTKVISVPNLTEGQACTCLLGEKFVDRESVLNIGACDNGMVWSKEKFAAVMADPKVDAVAWTFRHNPNVTVNPKAWGWVVVDKNNFLKKVSVKVPISEDLMNDHAIIGSFTFKKAKYFFDNAKLMIKQNRRINNEFYVDELMNVLVEQGLRVKVFEVDKYIGWGTPNDLKTYQYWEGYFQKVKNHGQMC